MITNCEKCGTLLKKERGIMPVMGTWMTGPGYHTGVLRSEGKVMQGMMDRVGVHYTCPKDKWWKFWETHSNYWMKKKFDK